MRLFYKDIDGSLVQAKNRNEWATRFQDEVIEVSQIGTNAQRYKVLTYFLGADDKHTGSPLPYETVVISTDGTPEKEEVIFARKSGSVELASMSHTDLVNEYTQQIGDK